ncbi:hypothetical protein LPJ61_003606 [Coemansia biformis]|uniref:FAD/NAD(P)-binding domain-containing protein n=1 Tax=Coemansia biformis TaxID=1286918 RepID=A0A9W8CYG1_9FUNG|nr:hypothetical protein LPJ61_003606 [Coemansia biformis]
MSAPSEQQGRRIAVVGSGLAGLTAAHLLQKGGCQVELFEGASSVGMDAGSLTVDNIRVDVPFRVMTPDYYPYLYGLYAYLGIKFTAADYSLGFADGSAETVWSYTNTLLGDTHVPIPDDIRCGARLVVSREWLRMAFACVKVMRVPAALRPGGRLSHMTIGQYLSREQYDQLFVDRVFLPFIASMLTCSLHAASMYPATTILHFVAKIVCGGRVRKAKNGVMEVCEHLTRGISKIHLSALIDRIVLPDDGSGEQVLLATCDGQVHWFDQVVLATPADTAARLLSGVRAKAGKKTAKGGACPPGELLDALQSVPYEDTSVFTHRDVSVMPTRRDEWRGVNIRTADGERRAMASHWINYVERTSTGRTLSTDVFQTVDPVVKLDAAKVISTSVFHRSLVTIESQAHINTVHRHQGRNGVWLVGTYTSPGVPLLEGCVRTAVDVARAIVGAVPFEAPRLVRTSKAGEVYEVGLGPGMVRGEVVEAYFECDAAGTFAFARPTEPPAPAPRAGLAAWLRAWLAWLAFTVLLPVLAVLVSAADAGTCAVLGRDLGRRVQLAMLDVLVCVAWLAQLAYQWVAA